MKSRFPEKIAPYVRAEIAQSDKCSAENDAVSAFRHLENAHVLGQTSTWWHVRVHWLMLVWAYKNKSGREFSGQILRIVGAATKTAIGLVPTGNTGGANISPFKRLPISPEHGAILAKVKSDG
tara:strand:- start:1318 stop:1686 length:369 start_codon:yes stop_codon:yes gene_type:complete